MELFSKLWQTGEWNQIKNLYGCFKTLTVLLKLCLSSYSNAIMLNVTSCHVRGVSGSRPETVQNYCINKKHRTSAVIDYRAPINDYLSKI